MTISKKFLATLIVALPLVGNDDEPDESKKKTLTKSQSQILPPQEQIRKNSLKKALSKKSLKAIQTDLTDTGTVIKANQPEDKS